MEGATAESPGTKRATSSERSPSTANTCSVWLTQRSGESEMRQISARMRLP